MRRAVHWSRCRCTTLFRVIWIRASPVGGFIKVNYVLVDFLLFFCFFLDCSKKCWRGDVGQCSALGILPPHCRNQVQLRHVISGTFGCNWAIQLSFFKPLTASLLTWNISYCTLHLYCLGVSLASVCFLTSEITANQCINCYDCIRH